ncbi:MAG TPA: CARDB domain-containing protein [Caldisericia bacterium]|nr:CARDB domain-containing protein [Caldisericia bacterium]
MKRVISLIILLLFIFALSANYYKVRSVSYETFYDFVSSADKAVWESGAGRLKFPGSSSDSKGFAILLSNPVMEDNSKYPKVLETHPEWKSDGWIKGTYPDIVVPEKAIISLKLGFLKNATQTDGITFRIYFNFAGKPVKIFEKSKTYSQKLDDATIDLSQYKGKKGGFILEVRAGKSSTQDWACWVTATLKYEKPEYPDLIITDIYVHKKTEYYSVFYKVKNIGNAPTSSPNQTPIEFTSALYLDDYYVSGDTISQILNPGTELERYFFEYKYTPPDKPHTLKVCTDIKNKVKESNEGNNCLEKKFYPSYGGIKVSTECPIVNVGIYDENGKLVKSGISDEKGVYSTDLTLPPGNYRVVPEKKGCTFDPPYKLVKVEAKELTGASFKCNCKKGPDLIITEIVNLETESTIHYKIKNIGDDRTNAFFANSLEIDGVQTSTDYIDLYLEPGQEESRKFKDYFYKPSPPLDKIRICADYKNDVKESNEQNNCLEVVRKFPDLEMIDINCDFDKKLVSATIKNSGEEKVDKPFSISLYINEEIKDSFSFDTTLNGGDSREVFFKSYTLECENFQVKVVVDPENLILEIDETNNTLIKTCECEKEEDLLPPKIIEGPTVTKITQSEAVVSWITDEESDSLVRYGNKGLKYGYKAGDSKFVKVHNIILKDLSPQTVYSFIVESKDSSGNLAQSKEKLFCTLPEDDFEQPSISLILPEKLQGVSKIKAECRDNKGVSRVLFFVDGKLRFTDFSLPFEWSFDTGIFIDGSHSFSAEAFDFAGNFREIAVSGNIRNRLPEEESPIIITIEEPTLNSEVYGTVRISATISSKDEYEYITEAEILIDGESKAREEYMRCMVPIYPAWGESHCDRSISYYWNTFGIPTGSYVIEVKAKDSYGNERKKGISVRKIEEPDVTLPLNITRYITRNGNYFTVTVTVRNTAPADNPDYNVSDFKVLDCAKGFQCAKGNGIDVTYSLISQETEITYTRFGSFNGRTSFTFSFDLVPILFDPRLSTSRYYIGEEEVTITYKDRWNRLYSLECPVSVSAALTTTNLNNAFSSADYLIVTNPTNLFGSYVLNDVNSLLANMAKLAKEKNGVLGYLPLGATNPSFDRLIDVRESGLNSWFLKLKEGWSSSGYLLIVGETEIVPSSTATIGINSDGNPINVRNCDLPYADSAGGRDTPELSMGRIIGNSAGALLNPIITSLEVKAGRGFRRSNALTTSGGLGTWEMFLKTANDAAVDLETKGYTTERLHYSKELVKSLFNVRFTHYDAFALGDIDSDDIDEILIAIDEDSKIYEYEPDGTLIRSINVRYTEYDGFATGDFDGDGQDEIVIGTDEDDKFYLYEPNGFLVDDETFNFTHWDIIATGDTDNDGKDEILIAKDDDGTVTVYDVTDGRFSFKERLTGIEFTHYDGFLVGNVMEGDNNAEIIVIRDDNETIRIYDHTGRRVSTIDDINVDGSGDVFYTHYDGFACGDRNGNGLDEIYIISDDGINDERRVIQVFYRYSDDRGTWKWGKGDMGSYEYKFDGIRYTDGTTRHDAFAIGNVLSGYNDEMVIAYNRNGASSTIYTVSEERAHEIFIDRFNTSARNKDVIVMRGHGNECYLSPMGTGDITANMVNHPFVLGLSCLTGYYDLPGCGDYSMGEAYLDHGAGVYIGATEGSSTALNNETARVYFDRWNMDTVPAGKAFLDYKNYRASSSDWKMWVYEYNFYGDPKFGGE